MWDDYHYHDYGRVMAAWRTNLDSLSPDYLFSAIPENRACWIFFPFVCFGVCAFHFLFFCVLSFVSSGILVGFGGPWPSHPNLTRLFSSATMAGSCICCWVPSATRGANIRGHSIILLRANSIFFFSDLCPSFLMYATPEKRNTLSDMCVSWF